MSSVGELFVNEFARDVFREQLDKEFGEGTWVLSGDSYVYDIWDDADLPKKMGADVIDRDTDDKLGRIIFTVKKSIGEDAFGGDVIEAEPDKIVTIEKVNA